MKSDIATLFWQGKQSPTLASFDFKKNSFGFLRFALAALVLYDHSFVLGGFGDEPISRMIHFQQNVAAIAVYGFFIISGFLVTRSLLASDSILGYGIKRVLRIFPGFWVCLVVTAFVFAPLLFFFDHKTLIGFINARPDGPVKYITTNFFLLMHQYSIAGLLNKNPVRNVFDGSLWTLWLEAKAYIALALIGLFGLTQNKRYLVVVLFIILWAVTLFNIPIHDSENKFLRLLVDKSFLEYVTYFAAGSVFFLFKEKIPFTRNMILGILFSTIVAAAFGLISYILPLTLPFLLLWAANTLPFQNFAKYGDFSYGIYIYAFPIQQLATFFKWNKNFEGYFIICFALTLLFAVASWFAVEQPFLNLKRIAS